MARPKYAELLRLVQDMSANMEAMQAELEALRARVADVDADKARAKLGTDLAAAVGRARARHAEFWRLAERDKKVAMNLPFDFTLTIAGRVIEFQAGPNNVPRCLVPIVESRIQDITEAQRFEQSLRCRDEDELLPYEEVQRVLAGGASHDGSGTD